MKLYFDTSVINDVAHSMNRNEIIKKIITKYQILFSTLTLLEIASTSKPDLRSLILNTARVLSNGIYPLARPQDILKRSLEALVSKANFVNPCISDEESAFWKLLMEPELINESVRNEIMDRKQNEENWLQDIHDIARPDLQAIIKELLDEDKTSVRNIAGCIRYFVKNEKYLSEFLAGLLRGSIFASIFAGKELDILVLEPWRFYLGAIALNIYNRTIRQKSYSKSKNAGTIDSIQAVYLATTDVFVTSDVEQAKMMRIVNCFGHHRRSIWSYQTLCNKLGVYP